LLVILADQTREAPEEKPFLTAYTTKWNWRMNK